MLLRLNRAETLLVISPPPFSLRLNYNYQDATGHRFKKKKNNLRCILEFVPEKWKLEGREDCGVLECFAFPRCKRKREVLGRNAFMRKDGWQLIFLSKVGGGVEASAACSERKTGGPN
ncbi:hypothetical protein L345_03113, partial [Ophiophagus hannah]